VIRPAIGTLNVWFTEAQSERYSPEEFIWTTVLPKNIHCTIGGRGNYSASRGYDILKQTGITILDTVLYYPQHVDYKPDWAYFNRQMRSSSGGPRTHLRTTLRSTVPYIKDGAEMTQSCQWTPAVGDSTRFTGVKTTQTQNFGSDVPAEYKTLPVPLFAPQTADILPVNHDHDQIYVEIWLDKRDGETVWKPYI
jgi:hypothetical protein